MPNYSVWRRESDVFITESECAYLLMVVTKDDVGHRWEDSLMHKPKFKPYSHAQFLGKGHVQNYGFLKLSC